MKKKTKNPKSKRNMETFYCTMEQALDNYFKANGNKKKLSYQKKFDLVFNGTKDDSVEFSIFLLTVLDDFIHHRMQCS